MLMKNTSKDILNTKKTVDSGENPKESPKKILDDLGVDRYCCRRMIITHVDLLEESAPYE